MINTIEHQQYCNDKVYQNRTNWCWKATNNRFCNGNSSTTIANKNVAAYIAGYLLGKIPVDTCQDWSNQLILPKLPSSYDELSVHEFLQEEKKDQEACCLVYPTPAMITFVDRLETLFIGIFEGIIHMEHVLARLCKCADDFYTFLKS